MSIVFPTDREEKRRFLLDAVRDVSETVRAYADASEEMGTLHPEIVRALQEAGLFKLKLPAELGGAEADPVTQMDVIEAMAFIYPSAAWVMMTNSTVIGQAGAMLPDKAIDEMMVAGEIPRASGAGAPSGVAVPVDGGFRLTGQWSFSSGVPHAQYISLGVRIAGEDDVPPEIRTFIVPAGSTRIPDNWQVAGLKGTGSRDVFVDDLFVPEHYTWTRTEVFRGLQRRGGAIFRLRGPGFVSNEHAIFPLALSRRALDLIIESSQTKRRGRGAAAVTLVDRPVFQRWVGRADLQLRAARNLTVEIHERAWQTACRGEVPDERHDAEMRASAVYCTDVGNEIVMQAFRYGGGAALHLENKLQQCLRDLNAGAQHLAVSDIAYENYGKFLLSIAEANPFY